MVVELWFYFSRDLTKPRDQRVMWFYGLETLMVSHHPGKFVGHGHCGSGDMFLVNEQEDSRCSRFSSPLLFISIGHGLKAHIILWQWLQFWSHVLTQQLQKHLKITFSTPSQKAVEKKKKENGNCKAFCVTSKRKNTCSLRTLLNIFYIS